MLIYQRVNHARSPVVLSFWAVLHIIRQGYCKKNVKKTNNVGSMDKIQRLVKIKKI